MSSTTPPDLPRRAVHDDGSDPREMLGAYAVDALDDLERARVERLIQSDLEAADELASFRETASRLAVSVAARPPAELRDRVLAQARQTRQVPPSSSAAGRAQAARATLVRSRTTRWLAVAAGVLALGCAGLGAVVATQGGEQAPVAGPTPTVTVTQGPARPSEPSATVGAEILAAGPLAGGSAELVQVGDRQVVLGEDVQPLAADRVYQLWRLQDGTPVPAGFLSPTTQGDLVGEVQGASPGQTVAVTDEPAGGSQAPTTDILTTLEA